MIRSLINHRQTFIFILSTLVVVLLSIIPAYAQVTGDYQSSLATMNWNSTTGWQRYNGTSWVTTATPPTIIASGNTVTVLAGHTVTNNLATISNSGTITVNGTLINSGTPFTNNASGVLLINGSFTNSASRTFNNSGSISNNGTFSNAGTHNNYGTLTIASSKSLTNSGAMANNGTINNSGTLDQNNVFTNAASGTLNNNGTVTILSAKTLTNSGIINNSGTISNSGNLTNPVSTSLVLNSGTITRVVTSAVLSFSANSTYKHNFSSGSAATGNIPIATWSATSNCEILACGNGTSLFNTSSFPTSNLGNFIWNNSSQAADINLNSRLGNIAGNFILQNSNGFKLILRRTSSGVNTNVSGNLTIASVASLLLTDGAASFAQSNHILTVLGSITVSGDLDLTSSTGIGINGTGTLNISGNFIQSASGAISKSGSRTGTININGTNSQSIESNGFTYGNSILFNIQQSGASGKAAIAAGKNFVINPGTTFNICNNTSVTESEFTINGTLQNSGNLNVMQGGAIDLRTAVITDAGSAGNFNLEEGASLLTMHPEGIAASGASGSIQVTGGRIFSNAANYTYNGTTSQITGTGFPINLNGKLTINNSGGLITGGVTLTQHCTIDERSSSSLVLINGKIISSSVSLLTLGDSSYISPAGGSTLSYVDGPVKKIGFYSGTEFIFPTGDAEKWSRIGFKSDISSSTDEFTAEYFKADPWALIDTTLNRSVINRTLNNISRNEYWDLDRTAGTATGKVKLYWEDDAFSGIYSASAANLRVAHHYNPGTGLKWYGESAVSPFVVVTTSGTSGTIESFGSITSFSPFTIGSVNSINPLPIELLSFTGKNSKNINHLNWSTSSETNNDLFELQRSADGGTFEKIAEIDGNGNSTARIDYAYDDANPVSGINYYRLKQIDFDGKHSYSGIVALENHLETEVEITTFPNPTTGDNVTISITGNISEMSVFNMLGEIVYKAENVRSGEKLVIDILARGVYTIRVFTPDQKPITSKFIKN